MQFEKHGLACEQTKLLRHIPIQSTTQSQTPAIKLAELNDKNRTLSIKESLCFSYFDISFPYFTENLKYVLITRCIL
jgi:hypothetical protein